MNNSKTGPRETDSISRVVNGSTTSYSSAIEPFYLADGRLVPDFPETLGDSRGLTGEFFTL